MTVDLQLFFVNFRMIMCSRCTQVLTNLKENIEHRVKAGPATEILAKLSPGVLHDLNAYLYSPVLRQHPFFKEMSHKVLRQFASILTVKVAKRGDVPATFWKTEFTLQRNGTER